MFRSRWIAPMRAVMALILFAFVTARPASLPCPMGTHSGTHSGAHSAAHGLQSRSPDVHASMAGMMAHGSGVSSDTPAQKAPVSHGCDCLSHCCVTAILTIAHVTIGQSALLLTAHEPHEARGTRLAREWTDFLLPFAIAPPVSTRLSLAGPQTA
jgi:hypothetical protein